jgi:putative transcriptional regulator
MPNKKYRSKALGAVHEAMADLHRVGLLDTKTMKEFDAACLTPVEKVTPRQIAALRKREGVSQAVFASYMNVTTGLVSKWERGEKHPHGPSLKLLALVKKKGLEAIA